MLELCLRTKRKKKKKQKEKQNKTGGHVGSWCAWNGSKKLAKKRGGLSNLEEESGPSRSLYR